ncbi:hypothetical protein F2P56_012957, partial [Juglans regia]
KGPSSSNLVNFYKETRWSKKKGAFVTPMTETLYNNMIEKLDEMELEERTDEAANIIFRDVIGHRSGYARGLGVSVIPEPRPSSMSAQFEHLAQENEKHKNEAMMYKTELDDLKREVRQLLVWQQSYDQRMNLFECDLERVSNRDTPGNV